MVVHLVVPGANAKEEEEEEEINIHFVHTASNGL